MANKAAALQDAYPKSHMQRALYLRQKNDLDNALVEFLKATQENPRLVRAFYEQALIFREKGYLKLAESALEQALAVKPDYQQARVLLATVRLEQGNLGGAVKELSRSLGLEPRQQASPAQSQAAGPPASATEPPPAPAPSVMQTPHATLSAPPAAPRAEPPAAAAEELAPRMAAAAPRPQGSSNETPLPSALSPSSASMTSRAGAALMPPAARGSLTSGGMERGITGGITGSINAAPADEREVGNSIEESGPTGAPARIHGDAAAPRDSAIEGQAGTAAAGQSGQSEAAGSPFNWINPLRFLHRREASGAARAPAKVKAAKTRRPKPDRPAERPGWIARLFGGSAHPDRLEPAADPTRTPQSILEKQIQFLQDRGKRSKLRSSAAVATPPKVKTSAVKLPKAKGPKAAARSFDQQLAMIIRQPAIPGAAGEPSQPAAATLPVQGAPPLAQSSQTALLPPSAQAPPPIAEPAPAAVQPLPVVPQPVASGAQPAPQPQGPGAVTRSFTVTSPTIKEPHRRQDRVGIPLPALPSLPPSVRSAIASLIHSHPQPPGSPSVTPPVLPSRPGVDAGAGAGPHPAPLPQADRPSISPPQKARVPAKQVSPFPAAPAGLAAPSPTVAQKPLPLVLPFQTPESAPAPERVAPPERRLPGGVQAVMRKPEPVPTCSAVPSAAVAPASRAASVTGAPALGAPAPAEPATPQPAQHLPLAPRQQEEPSPVATPKADPAQGFTTPALPSSQSKLLAIAAGPRLPAAGGASVKAEPPVPAPDEDEWTTRLRYLAEHGTSSLKQGEAFMFSEESGEAVLFRPEGGTVRRKVAEPRDHEEVARQRRPDITTPRDLTYNLSLLARLLPRPQEQQPAPAGQNFTMQDILGESGGFLGWLKGIFRF